MDPNKNPFAPGAGYAPPELAGRADILDRAKLTLTRIKDGRSSKGLLLVGLRGVGKTVLLNRVDDLAQKAGYTTVMIESVDQKRLEAMLIPALRSLLFKLDRMEGISESVKLGLRVLQGFMSRVKLKYGEVELSLGVPAEVGVADSGDLEADLPELIMATAQAAASRKCAVALVVDEMQYLHEKELSALIMAMHKIAQKQMPLTLIGAGLPPLLGKMGNSKSYAERLFDYPRVGALDRKAVEQAVQAPIEKSKAFIDRQAIEHIFRVTQGYPYFVQEWGHHAWNCAKGSNVDLKAAQHADTAARKSLDEGFFSVRFDRLTPGEKNYLRAMAYFGADAVKAGKVATALGQTVQSAAATKTALVKKGMVYSPSYGDAAFTVPLFDQFMRRRIPDWSPRS
jgi:hypothetical protein